MKASYEITIPRPRDVIKVKDSEEYLEDFRGSAHTRRGMCEEAPMNDEQKRIRSYLEAQAKLPPAAIVDKVRAAMADLAAAAAAVPAARFSERPAPEEWSANEVMAHVRRRRRATSAAAS